jgi:hypothetical protein
MSRSLLLAALLGALTLSPASAQAPEIQIPLAPPADPIPTPADLSAGELYVQIANAYDVTLSILGIPGATKRGFDFASGILRWNGTTYQGTLNSFAMGRSSFNTAIGGCSDFSHGTQTIFAVAHPEPISGLLPVDTILVGQRGLEDLVFHFFPENPPQFEDGPGDCQGMLRFEGYGPTDNQAPYSWLPQVRPPGDFLPFNDTRWTTQNGLLSYAPYAGEWLAYTTGQRENRVWSQWWFSIVRAY